MLEATFPLDGIPAEDVGTISLEHLTRGTDTNEITLYRELMPQNAAMAQIRSRQHFDLEMDGAKVGWGGLRSHGLAVLTVDGLSKLHALSLFHSVASRANLVSARLYEGEYEHWQIAEDPLEYQVAGRSMAGLPMRSNGLPFPLEQQVVNTSRNPGRRVLRQGYVEAIGHRMWLGPEYFLRVPGADQATIVNAAWLQVTEMQDGILEIVAADEPFVDNSTADIQNRLRKLLFPATA